MHAVAVVLNAYQVSATVIDHQVLTVGVVKPRRVLGCYKSECSRRRSEILSDVVLECWLILSVARDAESKYDKYE